MENNLLPAVIPKYRIKEYNSAYDFMFGKNKGWIFCTNFTHDYFGANLIAFALSKVKGLKHEVVMMRM